MADSLTIDVDPKPLLAALEAIPDAVLRHLKAAARITADRIVEEQRRRVQRRTGATAKGLTVEETHNGDGWVIIPIRPDMPNLPLWLAFGTRHLVGNDFFFAAARLEEGAHDRRSRAAVQAAIDEKGLGD
jgi:hypothetical protein